MYEKSFFMNKVLFDLNNRFMYFFHKALPTLFTLKIYSQMHLSILVLEWFILTTI